MTRELEESLFQYVKRGKWAGDWINNALETKVIASRKQAWRTLEKWTNKGLYHYGVSLEMGWFGIGATMPDRKAA